MKEGIIKDPLLGYIIVNENMLKLIDSYPLQRLRRIKQLCGSEYVYTGAVHCRFSHSLGVMSLAEQLISNLLKDNDIPPEIIKEVKAAALLHDIGHGPFSHVFEGLLGKKFKKNHEDITTWLILESEISEKLENIGLNPKDISKLAVGKLNRANQQYIDQIIASSVDVDSLDYIVRDSHFTGAEYGFVDIFRLIYTMEIGEDKNLAINLSALSTLEAFLLARFESFKSIYFHKTSRAVQIMLDEALRKVDENTNFLTLDSPEEYLKLDDYTTWCLLLENKESKDIIENLKRRKLLKVAYEKITHVKEEVISSILTKFSVRKKIEEEIAETAGPNVDASEVWIDVPTLPTVPYSHSVNLEPMEIPVFSKDKQGVVKKKRITEISDIIRVLKGFLNIVRVYTTKSDRDSVSKAAEEILGPPESAKISM
ncbi:MAG: HD domain-containing protein [Candidatus Lokiarchaeota archaeon]|nr:HD domain-containing protein [Candidatus Lokiarchaeota archaeon]